MAGMPAGCGLESRAPFNLAGMPAGCGLESRAPFNLVASVSALYKKVTPTRLDKVHLQGYGTMKSVIL